MGVLSNKIQRDQLRPGDHIYSWRHAYLYAHHGSLLLFPLIFYFIFIFHYYYVFHVRDFSDVVVLGGFSILYISLLFGLVEMNLEYNCKIRPLSIDIQ